MLCLIPLEKCLYFWGFNSVFVKTLKSVKFDDWMFLEVSSKAQSDIGSRRFWIWILSFWRACNFLSKVWSLEDVFFGKYLNLKFQNIFGLIVKCKVPGTTLAAWYWICYSWQSGSQFPIPNEIKGEEMNFGYQIN